MQFVVHIVSMSHNHCEKLVKKRWYEKPDMSGFEWILLLELIKGC